MAGRNVPGIDVRHSRACASRADGTCNCSPAYQAHVWSKRDNKRIRKTFPTLAAAKAWRADAVSALNKGTMRAPTPDTVRQAGEALIAGMKDGSIRKWKGGGSYKPSAIRSYEEALRKHLVPALGSERLCDLTRNEIQDLADSLLAQGLDPSTVRNALMPLRVIYRRAVRRGVVAMNPMGDLDLPMAEGTRERIAEPPEAARLLVALPEDDRPVWATALYAGLRLGELRALQDEDVDLEAGTLRVERSWDKYAGFIAPKSKAGKRTIPVCERLRTYLEQRERRPGFFLGSPERPFDYSALNERAKKAWKNAGIEPIGLHECRHSFSTFLDAAGVSETRADRYMGHSDASVANRYRHPVQYAEDAARLDDYLSGAEAGKVVRLNERAA